MSAQETPVVPELRQDLRLERGAPAADGTSSWVVVDSIQHRYLKIGEIAYQLLSIWKPGSTYSELQKAVYESFGHAITPEDISEFVRFLSANNLTVDPASGSWRHYADVLDRGRHGWLMWLVHNYLFIRVPLFRPESFLQRWLPTVAPLGSRPFLLFILGLGLTGLYLVSRQWDSFTATFQHFFSLEGAVTYGVALIIIKSAHELGHAFTAARFGCRVPSMGVCFIVLFPVLYTDVSDAWRLRSRHQRLRIGGAGIAVELALACIATFLWAFLPEGVLKSLAFSIATVGWLMSLVINLNPLMRFDGYYLFGDALGIDNLQARAFALGRWRLREILFDIKDPAPEQLSRAMERTLTIYAWLTWIYRVILFTGIALIVYHMAFKLLGVALFLIEIIYFVIRPIYFEIRDWWARGQRLMMTTRSRFTVSLAAVMFLWFVTPWSTRVTVPVMLEAAQIAHVYSQRAGFVKEVKVQIGGHLRAGDTIAVLQSSELDRQISEAQGKQALTRLRLARRLADDEERIESLVLEQELRALNSQLEGLQREKSEYVIKAPQDGLLVELSSELHPGRTVPSGLKVALLRSGSDLVARGYVTGQDVRRLSPNAMGYFVPEAVGQQIVPLRLNNIGQDGSHDLDIIELASVHGGSVAVNAISGVHGHQELVPVEAQYLATMTADRRAFPIVAIRGVAHLSGERRSFAGRAFQAVASVLIRESGI